KPDIDDDFNFEFEHVPCPMRGECTKNYCKPKLSSNLSKRELEIIPYLVEGLSHIEIGDTLYVSPITIKNHAYKIYKKLGFTGNPHPEMLLINYVYKNNIINQ
ncbi:MAG: LuxR C-terminal-related transcriptional regulator, partial [Spirochaetales bacterium]|nr:LuxR C-terminal-related transcriptional regulator [Spirochaetales bacterium]